MKYILTAIGLFTLFASTIIFTATNIEGDKLQDKVYTINIKEHTPYEKLDHDWECKYIVEDQYHGFVKYHYLDEYEELVDRSIQFIGNDGTVYRIPYPYYTVHENKQTV